MRYSVIGHGRGERGVGYKCAIPHTYPAQVCGFAHPGVAAGLVGRGLASTPVQGSLVIGLSRCVARACVVWRVASMGCQSQ